MRTAEDILEMIITEAGCWDLNYPAADVLDSIQWILDDYKAEKAGEK